MPAAQPKTRTTEVPRTAGAGRDAPVAACSPARRPARFAGPASGTRIRDAGDPEDGLGRIADRVDVRVGRPHVVVGRDAAARAERETGIRRQLHVRAHADAEQDEVRREAGAVGEDDRRDRAALLLDRRRWPGRARVAHRGTRADGGAARPSPRSRNGITCGSISTSATSRPWRRNCSAVSRPSWTSFVTSCSVSRQLSARCAVRRARRRSRGSNRDRIERVRSTAGVP